MSTENTAIVKFINDTLTLPLFGEIFPWIKLEYLSGLRTKLLDRWIESIGLGDWKIIAQHKLEDPKYRNCKCIPKPKLPLGMGTFELYFHERGLTTEEILAKRDAEQMKIYEKYFTDVNLLCKCAI